MKLNRKILLKASDYATDVKIKITKFEKSYEKRVDKRPNTEVFNFSIINSANAEKY